MRTFLKALIMTGILSAFAHAGQLDPQRVYEVGIASGTTFQISVSTSAATQMDNPTLPNRVGVFVQDLNSSANLWCGYSSAVTTSTGVEILKAGNFLTFSMLDKSGMPYGNNALHIWCIADGSSAITAAVAQSY